MSAPQEVSKLVKRFERNRESYRSSEYNETQARREFIDPFFKALGWDIDNEQGYAEAYKDVVHEDAIKIGGATKAPDYAFRIGGVRKFFVEAKRPVGVGVKLCLLISPDGVSTEVMTCVPGTSGFFKLPLRSGNRFPVVCVYYLWRSTNDILSREREQRRQDSPAGD